MSLMILFTLKMVVGAGNDPDGIKSNTDYESAATTWQPPPTLYHTFSQPKVVQNRLRGSIVISVPGRGRI